MDARRCDQCGGSLPRSANTCPHCARPGLFPNVQAAEDDEAELGARYEQALAAATANGSADALSRYRDAVATSLAVMNRGLSDLERLATDDSALYAPYYAVIDAGTRVPDQDDWDWLRRRADVALFPGYEDQIMFGALSLDGSGLSHFGPCVLRLRTDMISHRASVFEGNSVVWMSENDIRMDQAIPAGHRALWADRGTLAAVKARDAMTSATVEAQFPAILLSEGGTGREDTFIEVHIYGRLSGLGLKSVRISPGRSRADKLRVKNVAEKLRRRGIEVEVA